VSSSRFLVVIPLAQLVGTPACCASFLGSNPAYTHYTCWATLWWCLTVVAAWAVLQITKGTPPCGTALPFLGGRAAPVQIPQSYMIVTPYMRGHTGWLSWHGGSESADGGASRAGSVCLTPVHPGLTWSTGLHSRLHSRRTTQIS
jgi:hypothetical protein